MIHCIFGIFHQIILIALKHINPGWLTLTISAPQELDIKDSYLQNVQ